MRALLVPIPLSIIWKKNPSLGNIAVQAAGLHSVSSHGNSPHKLPALFFACSVWKSMTFTDKGTATSYSATVLSHIELVLAAQMTNKRACFLCKTPQHGELWRGRGAGRKRFPAHASREKVNKQLFVDKSTKISRKIQHSALIFLFFWCKLSMKSRVFLPWVIAVIPVFVLCSSCPGRRGAAYSGGDGRAAAAEHGLRVSVSPGGSQKVRAGIQFTCELVEPLQAANGLRWRRHWLWFCRASLLFSGF